MTENRSVEYYVQDALRPGLALTTRAIKSMTPEQQRELVEACLDVYEEKGWIRQVKKDRWQKVTSDSSK